MIPPKPATRPEKVSRLRYLRLFRSDILSAQPAKLYRAWMAEFKTPFFRSYLCNDPALVRRVLEERPQDFPKSERVTAGLQPLLGQSVFVTNGAVWERQRRIIDPAFEGGRLREIIPAMVAAGQGAVQRMPLGVTEIEEQTSHAAADVIFRALFSIPIESEMAVRVFQAFRDHQRAQPVLNVRAFLPRLPGFHGRKVKNTAMVIRRLIAEMVDHRIAQIAAGTAPDDLATRIITTPDPLTGERFTPAEMVDQVAIFFLAGHETSAAVLAWGLYLLAIFPDAQARVAAEAASLPENPGMSDLSKLRFTRDVFRETLRLYPPVAMMVRQTTAPEDFRGRTAPLGSQVVLSPWHLHRHERMWDNPDGFDPDRWSREETKASQRDAYLPFSSGPRVCTGAGFAMAEGVLLLALLIRAFHLAPHGPPPVPVANLTVRSRSGIWLDVQKRPT